MEVELQETNVDDLIHNIPDVLRHARQFIPWVPNSRGGKVPIRLNGAYGDYKDRSTWLWFDQAVDLVANGRAFGVGLALTQEPIPGYNSIANVIALDGDAKRCDQVQPYVLPDELLAHAKTLDSYTEFSPSAKGVRGLAFGEIPTASQSMTRKLGIPGTELSLFREGWVTLTGRVLPGSSQTIEWRQEQLDQIVQQLWPEGDEPRQVAPGLHQLAAMVVERQPFTIDWTRSAEEGDVRQLIQGMNKTPAQIRVLQQTWDLQRGFSNHRTPCDHSMYIKVLLQQAIWLKPYKHWPMQMVIDLVVTFCKVRELSVAVRKSEAITLGGPVMPVADGFVC